MDLIEVFGFLFMLSTMELGRVSFFLSFIPNQPSLDNVSGLLYRKSRRDAESYARGLEGLWSHMAEKGENTCPLVVGMLCIRAVFI